MYCVNYEIYHTLYGLIYTIEAACIVHCRLYHANPNARRNLVDLFCIFFTLFLFKMWQLFVAIMTSYTCTHSLAEIGLKFNIYQHRSFNHGQIKNNNNKTIILMIIGYGLTFLSGLHKAQNCKHLFACFKLFLNSSKTKPGD